MRKPYFLVALLVFLVFAPTLPPSTAATVQVKDLIESNGTTIDSFDSLDGWTKSNPDMILVRDTVNKVEGSAALKLTNKLGSSGYITKIIDWDFSNVRAFSFWVNIWNRTQVNSFAIYVSSSTGVSTKNFKLVFSVGETSPGWTHLVVDKAAFVSNGGESWSNRMVRLRFEVTSKDSVSRPSVSFDGFTYDLQAKAKCVITFDDGRASDYVLAKPVMDANNQKGVSFVNPSTIGLSGKLSLSRLHEMYGDGWDISDHSFAHQNLNQLSAAALDTEINSGYSWLVANGFTRSAIFFAYPYGYGFDNVTVVDKVKENHIFARTRQSGTYQSLLTSSVPGPQYVLRDLGVLNSVSPSSVEAAIDKTINQRGLLILTFHEIVTSDASGSPYYYLQSDFQRISDYLASKSASIDVVTFSYLVNQSPVVSNLNAWIYPDDYQLTTGGEVATGKTLRIYSQVSDIETASSGLEVSISYRSTGGAWTTKSAVYNTASDYWYIDWTVPGGATAGLYDVKIDVSDGVGGSATSTTLNMFKVILASVLTVTSPNGGEKWVRGTTHAIKWASVGSPGASVKIELLKAGAVNFVILASTANDGSYSWSIPAAQASGTDYRIRVTSTTTPSITDSSNANFAISVGALTVTSPNGGESWQRGATNTITWSSSGSPGSNVKIELLKGGVVNRVISSSTANDGSYRWAIPSTQTRGSDYRIKITSTTFTTVSDSSNSNFSIR